VVRPLIKNRNLAG